MAGKDSNKLKNLFFFGVSYVNYDSTDVTLDIITNIRRRFLVTRKPASNKLYRSANGESLVYNYNFSFNRPLQWKVSRNKKTVEEIEHLLSGKYCINLYDEQGKDLKKTFFDSKHRWFKTNYYSPVSNETLACTLVPKEFDEGTSLLKYITGEVYPERLYACTIPSCDAVLSRVLEKIPTPSVTALTNLGVVYFMTEVDKENYEHILSEEEAAFAKENAPVSFVSDEDAATGFNLSVKDFDMSKNLNRTFDISLAQDFDAEVSVPEEIPEPEAEPETHDDGSVDAAITDAVEQINALTSLEIDAGEILNFDISALNNEENEDNLFADSEPTIDIQLRHIESVLDENALLNSEHKLMVGDSVVDDDYISSIIDGIIASAFETDEEETEETLDEAVEATETEEPVADEENEPVCLSGEDFIKETPADLTIESRGESYFYYGSVDENGKRSGRGRTLMSDGSIAYEGFYEDDKRKGQGSFYFKDGTLCYWGNWSENVRSGFGVGVSSEDKAVHIGNWSNNKPVGLGARFDNDGNLMFISTNCDDKKKGFTISDFSDTSFTIRVWSEKDDAFVQQEISINDILK
ncbi:MAG: hypothetical protein IJF52_02965 [Clostridia bacterium]|nr:hypothetical protein [Clostridia bacterium]